MEITCVEELIIIDNLFTEKEILNYENWAAKKDDYRITTDGEYGEGKTSTFSSIIDYKNFDVTTKDILNCLEERLPFELPDFCRYILNCFKNNDFCDTHMDSSHPNGITFLIYLNSKWETNWGGDTYFSKNKEAKYWISVLPQPGRIVIAPHSVWHGSRSPSLLMNSLARWTLVLQSTNDDNIHSVDDMRNCFINGA